MGETGLLFAVSLLTGVVTNFMSDGATVAAVGPIAVPMAQAAGMHPWMLGFAAAFASSFAHLLIIGTPANALVYILCKDPRTGKQMVTQGDFLKHGAAVFVISLLFGLDGGLIFCLGLLRRLRLSAPTFIGLAVVVADRLVERDRRATGAQSPADLADRKAQLDRDLLVVRLTPETLHERRLRA